MSMEQYLLQLPKRLAQEVRTTIANGDAGGKVEMISSADNKHFKFLVNGKEYGAKIAQLPTILETHKTYDDNFLYKSGEIGQIFVVCEKEDEKKALETFEELPHGVTPPNTNVVKRKYEKTRRYTPFPKPEVARVEEDLVRMIQGGPYEEVQEELVDFCDWMVTEEHPNGIIVSDELELIQQHPEYNDLTSAPPTKQLKSADSMTTTGLEFRSVRRHSDVTGADNGSEVESQAGMQSAQRSPAFVPSPSPSRSPIQRSMSVTANGEEGEDDEDDDDMEADFLSAMEEKKPTSPVQVPIAVNTRAYLEDPAYHQLIATRDRWQKAVRDAERDVNEYTAKVNANSNIVVKNRFKQMMETAQAQRDEAAAKLEQVLSDIQTMENS